MRQKGLDLFTLRWLGITFAGFWGRRITIGARCSINSNRILVVDVVKIVEVQVDMVAVVASVAVVV